MGPDELAKQVRLLREAHGLSVPTAQERMVQAKVQEGLIARVCGEVEKPTAALATVRKFIVGRGRVLVLAGTVGCGKSFASAWACGEVPGARYVRSHEFEKPDDELDKQVCRARLLVIDDAGTEYVSEKFYASGRIEAAVIDREGSGKQTILTTNQPPERFFERYGPRLKSRIRGEDEKEGGGWFNQPAIDLRQGGKLP